MNGFSKKAIGNQTVFASKAALPQEFSCGLIFSWSGLVQQRRDKGETKSEDEILLHLLAALSLCYCIKTNQEKLNLQEKAIS